MERSLKRQTADWTKKTDLLERWRICLNLGGQVVWISGIPQCTGMISKAMRSKMRSRQMFVFLSLLTIRFILYAQECHEESHDSKSPSLVAQACNF